jgi:Ca2+-binding RTX toxin-like protein
VYATSALTAIVSGDEGTLTYRAASGEANVLTVEDVAPNEDVEEVLFRDAGATVTARGACVPVDAHTARCPVPSTVRVYLHDLNDTGLLGLAIAHEFGELSGGAGDDTLRTHPGHSSYGWLHGGPGDDVLTSSPDEWMDGGPGADMFQGGFYAGVSYWDHGRVPVRVSLDGVANDGTEGERDNVSPGMGTVNGSKGSDLFVGNDRRQTFYAQGGNDRAIGKGGNDTLIGHGGDDVLSGGPGGDRLLGEEGADTLRGGSGRDRFHGGRGRDRLHARDGRSDRVAGADGFDTACVDRLLDRTFSVEAFCRARSLAG